MLKFPVLHLRRCDFDGEGRLRAKYFSDKVVAVMVYSDSCPHCHTAAPEYQKAASQASDRFVFAAIHANGNVPGERECSEILDKILVEYRGVPDFAFFLGGIPAGVQVNGRTASEIIKTLGSLKAKKTLRKAQGVKKAYT